MLQKIYEKKATKQLVSCIAIVDPVSKQKWIIDATPDFPEQLRMLDSIQSSDLSGIFLTHAHIGHYTGLDVPRKRGDDAIKFLCMPCHGCMILLKRMARGANWLL